MTKANTLPKMPPAIATLRRKVFDCDVVADGWATDPPTLRVVIWRAPARPIQRTDTPDTPDLWRYSVHILGRGADNPLWRYVTSEQEAMACVDVIKLRPLTPRLCLEMGFYP